MNVSASGHEGNVAYFRAALQQERDHTTLLRSLIGRLASGDPVEQFYFPSGTFSNSANFFATLDALESAFIGANTTAGAAGFDPTAFSWSTLISNARSGTPTSSGNPPW